jgi:TatD DNase family protein
MWIDTHSHLYLSDFDTDRKDVFFRAKNADVHKIVLPNIDASTLPLLKRTVSEYPSITYPLIGLHPSSVTATVKKDLKFIENELQTNPTYYYGIGEIGIDLYWDKTFIKEQIYAFKHQLDLAIDYHLPAIIHVRNAFNEVLSILKQYNSSNLFGILHCFTGSLEQAYQVIDLGFYLGIGGISTFKNSSLQKIIKQLELKHLVVETDAPYLTPHPYRGKRNESSYIPIIGNKIAKLKHIPVEEIKHQTTQNAINIFNFERNNPKHNTLSHFFTK